MDHLPKDYVQGGVIKYLSHGRLNRPSTQHRAGPQGGLSTPSSTILDVGPVNDNDLFSYYWEYEKDWVVQTIVLLLLFSQFAFCTTIVSCMYT